MTLQPLPYHQAVVTHLRGELPAAWARYASDTFRDRQREAQRLHLLQSTVALSRSSQAELYSLVDRAAAGLGVDVPVELYQASGAGEPNAQLLYAPDAVRVVLEGAIQTVLTEDELTAVLAHELAHHVLFCRDRHAYLDAYRLLVALAGSDSDLAPTFLETLRVYQLHTEVFADSGAVAVCGAHITTMALLKVRTGLTQVSVDDFLEQSRELVATQGLGTRGWTHPEAHIRALAIEHLGSHEDDASGVLHLVEGPVQLDALDVLRRAELDSLTRRLVARVVAPVWMQTDAVMGHVRLLFDDEPLPPPGPFGPEILTHYGESVRDYLSAVLLDFVVLDPGLDDLPLLLVDRIAEACGLRDRLQRDVHSHLKRTKTSIAAALVDRDSRLAAADEAEVGR